MYRRDEPGHDEGSKTFENYYAALLAGGIANTA